MKKLFSAFAVFSLFMFASCNKGYDANNEDPAYGTKTIEYSIIAEAPGYSASATKADLGAVARVYWEANDTKKDQIKVYQVKEGTISTLTSCILTADLNTISDDKSRVTFSGTISKPEEGSSLLFVYAPILANVTLTDNKLSYSLNGQEISGNRVPFVAYATANYSSSSPATIKSTEFKLASSYVNAIIKDSKLANKTLTSITISNISNTVKFNASGVTPSEAASLNFTFESNFNADANGNVMFGFAVPASNETATGTNRTLTITAGPTDTYFTNFSNNQLAAASFYSTAITSLKNPKGFTINKYGKQVFFSPGNLWYGKKGEESVDKLHFEENQWSTSPEGSMTSSHVSHFFWTDKLENSVSNTYSASGSSFFADEGHKQEVDDQPGWYALSEAEWNYLLGFSNTTDYRDVDNRFARANVEDVNGLLIFPDGYTGPTTGDGIANVNEEYAEFPPNKIPSVTWSTMEAAGCVFLPVAGCRVGSTVGNVDRGYYWSSTASETDYAYILFFRSGPADVYYDRRSYGYSVRLVRESN